MKIQGQEFFKVIINEEDMMSIIKAVSSMAEEELTPWDDLANRLIQVRNREYPTDNDGCVEL